MKAQDFFLLNVTLLLWAGYYVAGRYAVDVLPPLLLTALRLLLVAAVLVPFVGRPKFPWRQILLLSFIFGTLNFGCGLTALAWGLDVPTAIVVSQLSVPFSCMFGAVLLNDRLGPWRSSGLVVAMMGAVVVAGTPNASQNFSAFLMLMTASAAWAMANVLMKKMGEVQILPFLGWMSLFAGGQLVVLSWVFESWDGVVPLLMQPKVGLSLLYLAFGSTLGAYWLWYYLLQRYLASQVTPYTMLSPFYAFALGYFVLGEPMTAQIVVGGLVTVTGVGIIVMRRPRLALLGKVRQPVHALAEEPQHTADLGRKEDVV